MLLVVMTQFSSGTVFNFSVPNHICGMAEARNLKFGVHVNVDEY